MSSGMKDNYKITENLFEKTHSMASKAGYGFSYYF